MLSRTSWMALFTILSIIAVLIGWNIEKKRTQDLFLRYNKIKKVPSVKPHNPLPNSQDYLLVTKMGYGYVNHTLDANQYGIGIFTSDNKAAFFPVSRQEILQLEIMRRFLKKTGLPHPNYRQYIQQILTLSVSLANTKFIVFEKQRDCSVRFLSKNNNICLSIPDAIAVSMVLTLKQSIYIFAHHYFFSNTYRESLFGNPRKLIPNPINHSVQI
jgi:hypothetical protein